MLLVAKEVETHRVKDLKMDENSFFCFWGGQHSKTFGNLAGCGTSALWLSSQAKEEHLTEVIRDLEEGWEHYSVCQA